MGKKREQESEREKRKRLTNNLCFFLKNKDINTNNEHFYKFSSSELREGMKKMGEVGSTSKSKLHKVSYGVQYG
jgi:hypothetical protein